MLRPIQGANRASGPSAVAGELSKNLVGAPGIITGNPLGPKPRDLIVPWARSDQPGYLVGGNKFDLDRWDPAYFARLNDFLTKAAERDIVVEICFFNSQYSDTWPISPLYYENNIQGEGMEMARCHKP
jgi:hypothetical protein